MYTRRRLRDSKRGKMEVSYIIAIAIGVILLFIVGYSIIYKKIGGTASGATPLCNSQIQKCACFFRGDNCPSVYMNKALNSEMCPPDGSPCDDNNYAELVKAAKKANSYGTCCQGPTGEVSPTRLKSYEATTTDSSGRPVMTSQSQPRCGDGVTNGREECDGGGSAGQACVGREGYFCSQTCRCALRTSQPQCGNGVLEVGEWCDEQASSIGCENLGEGYTCGNPGTNKACQCYLQQ